MKNHIASIVLWGHFYFQKKHFMNILVVWTWYVWLTHGACLADIWNDVICIDIDESKIQKLKEGIMPIYEPGLKEIVQKNHKEWRLKFDTSLKKNLDGKDVLFIAVGTPPGKDGHADLQYVKNVARIIGENIKEYIVVVTKSTVPVGTGDRVRDIIQEELDKRWEQIEFDIASNPEFLKEWTAIDDFKFWDRIVIWCDNKDNKALEILERLYSPLTETKILKTDLHTAEIIKYWANALLAVEISFINALSQLCEKVWADVTKVAEWLRLDSRIGRKAFLSVWPGFGGSCFPKDVMEFVQTFKDNNVPNGILDSTLEINESQKKSIITKVKKILPELTWKKVAVLGLAFKSNTDDIRYSSSLVVVDDLIREWANITAYDPQAMENFKKYYENIEYTENLYDCITDVDCIVIMTDWDEFKKPNWTKITELVKERNMVDTRNIYTPEEMKRLWFTYISMWR